MFEILHVLPNLLGTDCAGNNRGHNRMRQRKLERRRRQRHVVGFADRLNSIDFRHHLLGRVGIVVLRPRNPPGRGDPRVVYSADDDAASGALAIWKFRLQDVPVHEGIAERDKKEIEPDRAAAQMRSPTR